MKVATQLYRLLVMLTFLSLCAYAQTQVTIHTADDFPPYSYIEKHGELSGIHIDILKSIFAKMKNYRLKLQPTNWAKGLEAIEKGEILILSDAFYRPKKRPYILDYSDAYSYQVPSIYCNKPIKIKDNTNIDWLKEFKGVRIAQQKNASVTSSKKFQEALQKGIIKIVEYDNAHENLMALIEKKVDCYINEDLAIQGELMQKRREYKDTNHSMKELDAITKVASLAHEGIHLAFSKKYFAKRKDLLKKINLAIKVMRNTGEIEKIQDHYLHEFLTKDSRHTTIDASIFSLGSFVSDEMNNYGVLAEIVTTAFADRNISINYTFSTKNEAYLYNKWGRSCMSFPWTKNIDTWLYYELSDPIMTSDVNFFYDKTNLPDGFEYRNLYDMKDYRIGGVKGAFYESFFSGMSFNYQSYDNSKSVLIALTLKKIDILPMNRYLFVDAIKLYMPHKMEEFAHHEKPMTKKSNYILFSKNCENADFFKDEFNKGFENIQKNGTFDKILQKYTTTQKEHEEFEKIFRNLKKSEKSEEESVFEVSDSNHTDLNDSDLEISDSLMSVDEANITIKTDQKGEKKQ
jgi:polar amino acid transport system substrate-binding protein